METYEFENVADFFRWKNYKDRKSIEEVNKTKADLLNWDNCKLATLYSFLSTYAIGVYAYYKDECQIERMENNGLKVTKDDGGKRNLYSKNYLTDNYKGFNELNNEPLVKEFLELYFKIGNVCPIWPGGNEDKGCSGIYDIPDVYFDKYRDWIEAYSIVCPNAHLEMILNTKPEFKSVENLLDYIDEKSDKEGRIERYKDYLGHIVEVIRSRTALFENEVDNVASFHTERLAFAWLNGKLHYNSIGDSQSHKEWLKDVSNLSEEEWNRTPRGYIKAGRIQLFIGSNFEKLDNETLRLVSKDFYTMACRHKDIYGMNKVFVYNGVVMGKPGNIWKPIEEVCSIEV